MTGPQKYPCQCCGFYTLSEDGRASDDICPVCFWQDDHVQNRDPDFRGGANEPSPHEARRNFARLGAFEERFRQHVRPPNPNEIPPERQHG
jgi:hypothetical protein